MPTFFSRHTRVAWRCVTLSLVLSITGLTQQGCSRIPSVVKIGVAQPLSGDLAPLGQDMLNGVQLAVDDLNKEGFLIDGQPVTLEVVAVDDAANADKGMQVAQQLVDAKVVAVVGHLNSGVSIKAAPIYAKANIPQLAISTNPKYTELGLPTTFRIVANDNLQARAMGRFASENFNSTRFAVLDDGTPYGKDLAAGALNRLQEAKKEIVVQQTFDEKERDFAAVARRMKEGRVEAVVTTLSDFQVDALLQAMQAVGLTDIFVLGSDTLKSPLLLEKSYPMKLYATSGVLEARDFPNGATFLRKYKQRFNVEVTYGAHYSYDATFQLAAAIRRANSVNPDKITESLHRVDSYVPITGYMKWDAKGEQTYSAVAAYKIVRKSWVSQVRSNSW